MKDATIKTWKTAEATRNFRTSKPCTFCGRKHSSDCKFKEHPDTNTTSYVETWQEKTWLVPLGKAGAGRSTTTGETILCHIATTDAEPGVVDSSPNNEKVETNAFKSFCL